MKIYFKKDLKNYQTFPVPTNLEDYIEYEVDSVDMLEGKWLEPLPNGGYHLIDAIRGDGNFEFIDGDWQLVTEPELPLDEQKENVYSQAQEMSDHIIDARLGKISKVDMMELDELVKESNISTRSVATKISQFANALGITVEQALLLISRKDAALYATVQQVLSRYRNLLKRIELSDDALVLKEILDQIDKWQPLDNFLPRDARSYELLTNGENPLELNILDLNDGQTKTIFDAEKALVKLKELGLDNGTISLAIQCSRGFNVKETVLAFNKEHSENQKTLFGAKERFAELRLAFARSMNVTEATVEEFIDVVNKIEEEHRMDSRKPEITEWQRETRDALIQYNFSKYEVYAEDLIYVNEEILKILLGK